MKSLLSILFLISLCACTPLKSLPVENSNGSLEIHDIQGCSHRSPYENKTVQDVVGVVTWKVENGFYMQSTHEDGKDCSSEGIFVFTSSYPTVVPGDKVNVTGKVQEFTTGADGDNNLSVTEINLDHLKTLSTGNETPAAKLIGGSMPSQVIEDDSFKQFDPENDGLDYWESLEGMLVEVDDARVVEARNSHGEIVVIPGSLASQNMISTSGALVESETDDNPERIVVELPKSFKKDINLGARFAAPIIGVLGYDYGTYRILEQNTPEFSKNSLQPQKLTPVDENVLRVASYNLENWSRFDEDRTQQFAKDIVSFLAAPDAIMLQEVQDDSGSEDDSTTTAKKNITALVQAISDRNGPEYSYYQIDPQDGSSGGAVGANIRSVLLYRSDRVRFVKGVHISELGGNSDDYYGVREPLIARIEFNGAAIDLVGVHLVSNNLNSPLFGSVQPIQKPEEAKRILQAERVVQLTNELKRNNPDDSILVMGDFNDVAWSKTLGVFTSAGFSNPFEKYSATERYSIIFEGNAQQFDQILFQPGGSTQVLNEYIVHLNTGISQRNQTSDHDPVVLDLGF